MSSGITGDFGELDAAIVQLEQLAGVTVRAAKAAAPKLEVVARAQWVAGQGPSGKAWKKTKDGRVALIGLTSQIIIRAEGDAVVLRGPDELAFHAKARPVFPAPGDALPAPWRKPFEDALSQEIDPR